MSSDYYWKLPDVIRHIISVRESANTDLPSAAISVGDFFKITDSKHELHGQTLICSNIATSQPNPGSNTPLPREIEFRFGANFLGDLFDHSENRDEFVMMSVSEELCRRQEKAIDFQAVLEIISFASSGSITVKGRKKKRTRLEEIPADDWVDGRLDHFTKQHGVLHQKDPFAPDAVVWEDLHFQKSEVFEVWKLPEPDAASQDAKPAKRRVIVAKRSRPGPKRGPFWNAVREVIKFGVERDGEAYLSTEFKTIDAIVIKRLRQLGKPAPRSEAHRRKVVDDVINEFPQRL
jgi:hypothetical protein